MNSIRRLLDRWRRSEPPETSSSDQISVLAITSDDEDRRLLSMFAVSGRWELVFASSCEQALKMLERGPAPVILCDRDLPGIDWPKFLQDVAASKPKCAIILTSHVCDDYLWVEVVHKGGYDVLGKPLQQEQTIGAVNLAWSYSKAGSRVLAR